MVQLMNSGKVVSKAAEKGKIAAVKTEVEDPLEEAHGPLNKRSRSSIHGRQSMGIRGNCSREVPLQYNPLQEPSPLGLRLRKSPSLLELIQMTLSQKSSQKTGGHGKKDHKSAGCSGSLEKLKASNFPASILRIGTWEYISRYEGDLVAKCYFAKHKLVWEVLDGGLKNKIEIQWADIMSLKANYPDDAPGTLDVVLARPPLFHRETNPQPRKHTLWQSTSDFTNGQASVHRRHYMQCPQGLLGKHFEKLIQCDPRLNYLSQQPEIMLESPYFEPRVAVFEDPSGNDHSFEVNIEGSPAPFNLRDVTSPSGIQSSASMNERDLYGRHPDYAPGETPSPSSVMDTGAIEEIKSLGAEQWRDLSNWNNIRVPGLHSSMSMSDLVSHLEHRISEQGASNNITLSAEERQSLDILEDISRCLFSDTQTMPASDEKSLMTRVNSLCCLLQKDPVTSQTLPSQNDDRMDNSSKTNVALACESNIEESTPTRESDELFGCKQTSSSMSRKDSVGDLLLNLPRIASLPQIFCNRG